MKKFILLLSLLPAVMLPVTSCAQPAPDPQNFVGVNYDIDNDRYWPAAADNYVTNNEVIRFLLDFACGGEIDPERLTNVVFRTGSTMSGPLDINNSLTVSENSTMGGSLSVAGPLMNGSNNTVSDGTSFASGSDNTVSPVFSAAIGTGNTISEFSHNSLALGTENTISASYSIAAGIKAIASQPRSFIWNGDTSPYPEPYETQYPGTFNINPPTGLYGFYIGDTSLGDRLDQLIQQLDQLIRQEDSNLKNYIFESISNNMFAANRPILTMDQTSNMTIDLGKPDFQYFRHAEPYEAHTSTVILTNSTETTYGKLMLYLEERPGYDCYYDLQSSNIAQLPEEKPWLHCPSDAVYEFELISIPGIETWICKRVTEYTKPIEWLSDGVEPFLGNGVSITGTKAGAGLAGHVDIPDYINDQPVVQIGWDAFSGCSRITSMTIPDTVVYVQASAFDGCTALYNTETAPGFKLVDGWVVGKDPQMEHVNLTGVRRGVATHSLDGTKTIVIPGTLPAISPFMLAGCETLTNVVISPGVQHIYTSAFEYCGNLTDITIPGSVEYCDYGAFRYAGLTNAVVGCAHLDDAVFSHNTGLRNVTIEPTVAYVGGAAFDDCSQLESVNISDWGAWCRMSFGDWSGNPVVYADHWYLNGDIISGSVAVPQDITELGSYVFCGAKDITSIELPTGLTTINEGAFYGCSSSSIALPSSVNYIGAKAFERCRSLTSLTIPDGVTKIEEATFSLCDSLSTVVIPSGVTEIGNSAFYHSGLENLVIPDSVETVGYYVFMGCDNLQTLSVPGSWRNTDKLDRASVPGTCEIIYRDVQ